MAAKLLALLGALCLVGLTAADPCKGVPNDVGVAVGKCSPLFYDCENGQIFGTQVSRPPYLCYAARRAACHAASAPGHQPSPAPVLQSCCGNQPTCSLVFNPKVNGCARYAGQGGTGGWAPQG